MTLRYKLRQIVKAAALQAAKDLACEIPDGFEPRIDYTPDFQFGHYATPVAMELAKIFKKPPRAIADALLANIDKSLFSQTTIAGAGFINFTLTLEAIESILKFASVDAWLADSKAEVKSEKIIFEYVSANPTGPMNIVSARAASVGDSLTRILKTAGHEVHREYYVNDYGNQVEMLGLSFAYRYLQKFIEIQLPENCYQGDYVAGYLDRLLQSENLPTGIELTAQTVSQIERDEWLLAAGKYFAPLGIQAILSDQKQDLANFRAEFDDFFSETSLHASNAVMAVADALRQKGKLRREDGAELFTSTEYGDDKDRVVVRSDGRPTYLLADIAYHKNKIDRGFRAIVDIWGPDHHGYIARLSGALKALGFDAFKVIIAQQVNLLENGEPVVMSKRLGKFQTMRDLIEKIPVDVCRYFFVTRALGTHLDFDLTLALNQSKKNPVYYIQYAHARIWSIFRETRMSVVGAGQDAVNLRALILKELALHDHPERYALLLYLLRFPELVHDIARNYEIQRLPEYLYQIATLFTAFYHGKANRIKDLFDTNVAEAHALLALCGLTAQVLEAGLSMLGINAPQEMRRDESDD